MVFINHLQAFLILNPPILNQIILAIKVNDCNYLGKIIEIFIIQAN